MNETNSVSASLWGHWGIALLILIVIALFYGVTSRNNREDRNRLTDTIFNINGRLGIVEKGTVDNERQITKVDQIQTSLTQDYSFRVGGLTCQTNANAKAIGELGHFVPNCGYAPVAIAGAPGVPANGGARIPEFTKVARFVQDGDAEIVQREACGNAYN